MGRNHPLLVDAGLPRTQDPACHGSLAVGDYCGVCAKCRKAVGWLVRERDRLVGEIEHLRDLIAQEDR